MALSYGWGLVMALISMICNGSFSSLNKLPKVQATNVNPLVFNLYFIFGVIVSSLLVYISIIAIGWTVEFTYLGVISGFLIAISAITLFATIQYIGLSIGVTIWSGTAILVSFGEGFIVSTDVEYLFLAIIGVIILIFGIIGVGFSEQIVHKYFNSNNNNNIDYNELSSSIIGADINHEEVNVIDDASLLIPKQNKNELNNYNINNILIGILYAVLTGITGGSIGFPSNYTNDNNSGLKYLISFAVGSCLIIPITIFWAFYLSKTKIEWHLNTCLIPGLLAGVVWNGGNLASLYAIQSLSYSVAYPIMQSSLIIANLWGIFVWKEFIDNKVIATLLVFCCIVMIGCATITVGVNGT